MWRRKLDYLLSHFYDGGAGKLEPEVRLVRFPPDFGKAWPAFTGRRRQQQDQGALTPDGVPESHSRLPCQEACIARGSLPVSAVTRQPAPSRTNPLKPPRRGLAGLLHGLQQLSQPLPLTATRRSTHHSATSGHDRGRGKKNENGARRAHSISGKHARKKPCASAARVVRYIYM